MTDRQNPTGGRTPSPDGVEIAYDVAGSGDPALVFVHGWAGNRHHWDGQLDRFARDHRVVRLDLAGHGESGTGRRQWTMTSFAYDVIAAMDAVHLETAILIGHSLGGSVVIAAARILGPRVAGVIGIDTWSALASARPRQDLDAFVPLQEMRSDFQAGSAHFVKLMCGPAAAPELIERITHDVTSMPPDVALAVLGGMSDAHPTDLEDGLRSLAIPVSAISCETFLPKDSAVFASCGITNVMLPGTGHYLMLERPDDFNRELAAAITRTLT